MTYRNILVQVDTLIGANARIAAAGQLALRFGCPLTGAFLRSSRLPNYMFADAITPISQDALDGYLQERMSEVEAASQAAKKLFDANVPTQVKTRWLDIEGETDDELIACAKRHDLVIIPPEIMPAFSDKVIPAARIGMASGGPVLVLKRGGYPVPFGGKILVAWSASRESVRAIRDAWPFLEAAHEIHFLRVGEAGDSRELDALMRRQLQDHGCPAAQFHFEEAGDTPVEDVLRLHIGRTGADLLVSGLYGHSRLREFVVGGVSRNMLSDPPMPLLMSH